MVRYQRVRGIAELYASPPSNDDSLSQTQTPPLSELTFALVARATYNERDFSGGYARLLAQTRGPASIPYRYPQDCVAKKRGSQA
jgi:hypothetical protein